MKPLQSHTISGDYPEASPHSPHPTQPPHCWFWCCSLPRCFQNTLSLSLFLSTLYSPRNCCFHTFCFCTFLFLSLGFPSPSLWLTFFFLFSLAQVSSLTPPNPARPPLCVAFRALAVLLDCIIGYESVSVSLNSLCHRLREGRDLGISFVCVSVPGTW